MLSIYKCKINVFAALTIAASVFLASCSKDNNPVEPGGNTAKVSGRISTASGASNSLNKTSASVQGATVILAKVQADGSLKTVSTQSVQTDAAGKFIVETNLNGETDLVVVATQGAVEWKAVVSSAVQSGSTVYAPPLCAESTTETDLYIKFVSQGNSNNIDAADLKVLLDSQGASNISSNNGDEVVFMSALQAQYQATIQAAGNSSFGLSGSQFQAMLHAKAYAKAKLDAALYNSDDSDDETDNNINGFEGWVCTNSGVNANVYAELMRVGATAFLNAATSMSANGKLAITRCFYKRYAFVLDVAMRQQFQAAGAADAQLGAVASAGATLYSSIKTSADLNSMTNAFIQYHSSIKSQLELTLSAYSNAIETVDSSINSTASAKAILNVSLNGAISVDAIVNAYVVFFNSVSSAAQTALAGASSAQIDAAAQILILSNMN
jgi:hypothetical protein